MPAFPTPSLPPLGGSLCFPAVDTMQPVSQAPTAKPSSQGRVFPRLPVTLSPASPLRSFSQVSCHSDTCTQSPASVQHCTPYFRRLSALLSEPSSTLPPWYFAKQKPVFEEPQGRCPSTITKGYAASAGLRLPPSQHPKYHA